VPKPLADDIRAAILDDIRAGKLSARAIAKHHGVAPSTVSKLAADSGVAGAFERAQTVKATAARKADTDAKLAEQLAEMIDDVGRLRARIWGPYDQVASGREGAEVVTLPMPPLRDVQAGYTSIGIILDKYWKRQDRTAGGGHDELREVLRNLGRSLGVGEQQAGE